MISYSKPLLHIFVFAKKMFVAKNVCVAADISILELFYSLKSVLMYIPKKQLFLRTSIIICGVDHPKKILIS